MVEKQLFLTFLCLVSAGVAVSVCMVFYVNLKRAYKLKCLQVDELQENVNSLELKEKRHCKLLEHESILKAVNTDMY